MHEQRLMPVISQSEQDGRHLHEVRPSSGDDEYLPHGYGSLQLDAFEHWRAAVTTGFDAERVRGSDTMLRISRANLLANPEVVFRQCLDFVDEPFDLRCLRLFRSGFNGCLSNCHLDQQGARVPK
jgi:hypothetical protein